MTITDPFGTPGPVPLPDRGDPFGVPSDSGRATRMGDAEDRAEVPRDQWDRYLLHHLDGTKPAANKGFTRVSTTKSALSNTFGIQDWAKRRVIEGIGKDETLVQEAIRASRMPDGPDKEKALRRVASAGFDLGGGKERSGLGTEFHELTEAFNRGEDVGDPKWDAELDAYTAMLYENNIRIRPEYLERQVLCPYNNAGTFDNIVEWWNPDTEEWELVVGDLKTGRSLDLGWLEIEMQLWLYANAYGLWTTTNIVRNDPKDPDKITDVEGFYEPMPLELRRDKALIFHVPLDGTATLYVIDLSGVDTYVEAAVTAKRANAEAKNKVRRISTYRPAAFVAQDPLNAAVASTVEPAMKKAFGVGSPASQGWPAPEQPQVVDPNVVTRAMATPDQQAQVDKAAERLTKVDEMARAAGRNDGDVPEDSPTSDASVTTPPVTIERDPVTGRKKRTCGFCHKPGHTQKTCPENPASAKYQKPELKVVPEPAGEPAPGSRCNCLGDDDWHPIGTGGCLLPPGSAPETAIGLPYCTLPHDHQWTSQHSDAPGQWVCSTSGKPGKQAYEAGATALTNEPPTYGAPDYAVGDSVTVAGIEFTKHSEGPTWAAPPDMVLWGIKQAKTQTDVLLVRGQAIQEGTWNDVVHDPSAKARYIALTPK